ncbi:MAG: hypothetical protein KF841_09250 [Phycisphaerae bacterium]|nr:hypothetical protein [Phycisphaerae bacterium]
MQNNARHDPVSYVSTDPLSRDDSQDSPAGAAGVSGVADGESADRSPTRLVVILVPILIVALYFGYLWFVSGVLPVVERFPNGKPQTTGYVKRHGVRYERTGRWTIYHPNGGRAAEGMYEQGRKLPESWHYWDESGREIPEPQATQP